MRKRAIGSTLLVLATVALAVDDPQPTPGGCWSDFEDRIRECGNLETPEMREACNNAARDVLRDCLDSTPPSDPPPTAASCFVQLILDLKRCRQQFPPGGTGGNVNDRHRGCVNGAYEKFRWCMSRAEAAENGFAVGAADAVQPFSESIDVAFEVLDAATAKARVWFVYNDDAALDGTASIASAPFVISQTGQHAVTVAIPDEVFTAKTDSFDLVVELLTGADSTIDADGKTVEIAWQTSDLNRDGDVNSVDLGIATETFFNGDMTADELNAVISDVEQD